MIKLRRRGTAFPALHGSESVPAGRVFVATKEGDTYSGQLQEGRQAVVEAEGISLEVTTRSALSSAVTAPGTYLNREELRRVGFRETVTPKLRRYGFQDTLRKVFSPAGAILLLITVLGVLGAALSFWIAVVGESPTSAREVSERSQTLVTWVTAPADRLEGADSPKVALGRRFIRRREATAERCLRSLGGGEPSGESPGGVSCVPKDVPWWKDKEAASGVGLLIGLAVTLLGGLGVRQRFGFGGRP